MMRPYALGAVLALALPFLSTAQTTFFDASSLMSNTTTSGGCMGVADMNGDGLDDLCKLHNSKIFQVDYQNPDGSFTLVDYGQISTANQWGMSLGDITNSGHKDLVCGGSYDGVRHLSISSPGVSNMTMLNNGSMFMQCNNMADINNDGHLDFFACHDDAAPRQWLNDGDGLLSYADIISYTTTPSSDMSGNYGSVWTDFDNDGDLDLYIAKCRQNVNNPEDPRRWNRLFVNDGNGNYTDMAATYGVQVKHQSWTADFGDIDNDGDMDLMITNHDSTIQLFENDGTGNFTEITAGSGLEITGFFLQSKFVDFDNDGYIDLLIAGGIERYFHNNGDKTFTAVNGLFPAGKAMHGFATGDLNNDGFIDVFANYGSNYVTPDPAYPDRLWMNHANDNNWVAINLQGTESNRDAVGARVTLIGPWGTQIREVRSGESYGIVTSFTCNFGLGSYTTIPTVIVRWPSGLVEEFNDIAVNQHINIIEGTCIAPTAQISFTGATALCTGGEPLTLQANPGFTYTWSTGAQTQQIEVSEPGYYTVTVSDGDACSSNTGVFVALDPDQTPTISVDGDLRLCEGSTVELDANTSLPTLWSNGATTSSIAVTTGGTYTVTVTGDCATYSSEPIVVEIFDAPPAPTADDVSVWLGQSATLNATGENVNWYDVALGGTPIATGSTYNTPALFASTSYWAASTINHEGEVVYGAKEDQSATGGYHTNGNFYLLFNAYQPMTIRSVKVYANGAGNRPIAVVDMNGTTIASGTFNIPDGESRVQLNFDVPAGGPYGLRIVSGNPQLWRDQAGSVQNYPYALGDLGAITSTTATGTNATALYYFFYDWEVAAQPVICESPRTEVVVSVGGMGISTADGHSGIRISPNPADDVLTIAFDALHGQVGVQVLDMLGRVVLERTAGDRADQGRLDLNVSKLSAGDYLVRVQHAGGIHVSHVVIY
jgi:hypothetical protein